MKTTRTIIAMVILMLASITVNAQTRGSIWWGRVPPTTKPTNFQSGDAWVDTLTGTTYRYNGGWYKPSYQLLGAVGPQGPAGPQGVPGVAGKDGVCPSCPTTGATGPLKSIGKIAICYNDSDIKAALAGYEAGTVSAIWMVNDVGTTTGYDIPLSTKNQSFEIPIFFWGNTSYDATTGATALESIWRRRPANQDQAMAAQGHAVVMKDGLVKGRRDEAAKQPMTGTLIDISSTYGSNLENMDLQNGKNGFMGRFCMLSEISHSKTVGVRDTIFAWTIGNHPGATGPSSNAQSNSSVFRLDRAQATAGTKVCFYKGGSSNVWDEFCIAEQDSANYAVLEQDLGSPNELDGGSRNLHVELGPRIAAIESQKKQGMYSIDGLYFQKNGVVFSAVSTDMSTNPPGPGGYFIVDIRNLAWLTPGNKFKSNNNNPVWDFRGTSFGMDIMQPANWVGGSLPANYSARGFKGADDNSGICEYYRVSKRWYYGNSWTNGITTINGKQY